MLLLIAFAISAADGLEPAAEASHSCPTHVPRARWPTEAMLECAFREKRATANEDMVLLPLLLRLAADLRKPQTPHFIEIGAYDGLHGSQTLVMERCFGWRGALIEASPPNFEQLSVSNRTGAMVNAAVCDKAEGGVIQITVGGATVAGDVSKMGKAHLTRWRNARGTKEVPVPCKPLLSIYRDMMSQKATAENAQWVSDQPVSYMSLDVEGSELDVLQSVPNLGSHPFDVILMENEYGNMRDRLSAKLLRDSNYTRFLMPHPSHGGTNDLYVSQRALPTARRLLGPREAGHHEGIWKAPYSQDIPRSIRQGLQTLGMQPHSCNAE